jgi:hypothetical protein
MDKITFKFDNLSYEDLEVLSKAIENEYVRRKSTRFNELATAAADALNALRAEFPGVVLAFNYDCDHVVNIFEIYDQFEAGHFHQY